MMVKTDLISRQAAIDAVLDHFRKYEVVCYPKTS